MPPDAVMDLARRMEARAANGFSVSPETARLIIDALRSYAAYRSGLLDTDRLRFRVERWAPGDRVEELAAAARGIMPARAAYFEMWRATEEERRSGRIGIGRLLLRQGARVILDSNRSEEWPRAAVLLSQA